jgi:NNP family nitrate/nitrite transporter-like MFS transporter
MISEWFPARQTGVAQGIYGGWGNFGSAAAAILLPALALMFGGDNGWRYAVAATGIMSILYGVFYYFVVTNTPKGSTYFKPKKMGGMEVTSKFDFFLYLIVSIPMYGALALLAWKLSPAGLNWFDNSITYLIYGVLLALYFYQAFSIYQVNKEIFIKDVPDIFKYDFSQVAVLNLAYLVTFGSELALVSMLPLFYKDTFDTSTILAGVLAAIYPMMNLIARPAGGIISDKYGRKRTLIVLFTGITLSFALLAQVDASWALPLVVVATIVCGLFSKAGSGAVFAMVPLIHRRMTGQIAGMAGAYGNVGGVLFLTILSFVSTQAFFMFIAGAGAIVLFAIIIFSREPQGQMAEVMPDGTVEMIDVS